MKQQLGPGPFRAVLFDIDNTLYRDDRYAQWQVDVLVEEFGRERSMSTAAAQDLVAKTRRQIAERDGRSSSLANTLLELGISIDRSVEWRRRLIRPRNHLAVDRELRRMLLRLAPNAARPAYDGDSGPSSLSPDGTSGATASAGLRMAALTNNPVDVGRESLEAIGIADLFETVIGLDTTWHSKPHWEPFAAALSALGVSSEETIMVGDRWDVDLAPMIDHGGGGLLIESRADLLAVADLVVGASR